MRKRLEPDTGLRKKFRAVFIRFGKKTNFRGHADETVLLGKVTDIETNEVLTDHLWFAYTKRFQKTGMKPGAILEFEARIKAYQKGYVNRKYKIDNRRLDYRLSHPSRISIIGLSRG